MSILNCTPDSFYDGGHYFRLEKAVEGGLRMAKEGADILDIGGESTRPFSLPVSEKEELSRVIPVIQTLSQELTIPLSIDTCKPKVAEKALEAGASFINDTSGFRNPDMRFLAKQTSASICVMHIQGTPKDMQQAPCYPKGIINELVEWFSKQIDELLSFGIQKDQIILDPGIGYGKTVQDTIQILKNLPRLKALGCPILIGLSRKSFMTKILGKPATELLSTTIALNTMSILEGASIIRVHDVKEHRDVLDTLSCFED